MNILVTIDKNYMNPLVTMLYSLFFNNKGRNFDIYIMHSDLEDEDIENLNKFCKNYNSRAISVKIGENAFSEAPTLLHYTKEMYFRLLAYKVLPENLDRILYLDPDILVINDVERLYNMDFEGSSYIAAYHDKFSIDNINKLRFLQYEIEYYFNSGVLLMNLEKLRKIDKEKEIYDFIEKYGKMLVMPDQDVLNALYARDILPVDDKIYNYDARFYAYYKYKSSKEFDMDHVMENTVVLHFCGGKKPWHDDYIGKFHSLYGHYKKLSYDSFNQEKTN